MKKEPDVLPIALELVQRSSWAGWRPFGRTLSITAALIGTILNISAAARRTSDADNYRHVAFVGTAVAKSTSGDVEYLSGNSWLPARAGQVFSCEQLCRTKANGRAIFQMRSSGSLVRIDANTVIRFCALDDKMQVASLTGYEAATGRATVRAVRGAAQFLNSKSEWQPLRVNSLLPAGASVRTMDKTTVDLFFADTGLVMRVEPNSRVTLNQVPLVAAGEILTNRKTLGLLAQADTSNR